MEGRTEKKKEIIQVLITYSKLYYLVVKPLRLAAFAPERRLDGFAVNSSFTVFKIKIDRL